MQKKHRKIIFIIFVILFLISAPLILLYTGGYRYNFTKNRLEQTGNLLINTKTDNTTVFVNNKSYYNKNEFRIKNILPGDYLIKISKAEHFDWQKKLAVISKFTTFIKDIRLFKKNLPINLVNKKLTEIYPSYDKKKLVHINYDTNLKEYVVSIFNTANDKETKLLNVSQRVNEIKWSPDNNKFLIKTKLGFKVIDIIEGEINIAFLNNKIYDLGWDKKDSLFLFAKTDSGIYKINLLLKTATKLYSVPKVINNFNISQDTLYVIDQYSLRQIDLKNKKVVYVPLERKDYKIKTIKNNKLYLMSKDDKLQIFDLPLNKLSTPILLVSAKGFDVLNNNLLFYNDFELWTYSFDKGTKELITRIGANIKKARWANDTNYIVYILENQIKIIEVDKRDKRQVIGLVKFGNIKNMMLTEKFNLYFIGEVNKASGLYKLEI